MRTRFQELRLHRIYHEAGLIEDMIRSRQGYDRMDWNNPILTNKLYRPTKFSLLHEYILGIISESEWEFMQQRDDLYEDSFFREPYETSLLKELDDDFQVYGVAQNPRFPVYVCESIRNEMDYSFREWIELNRAQFDILWRKWTYETFHIIFSNRELMKLFNVGMAEYLKIAHIKIPPEYLTLSHSIKRVQFPAWLKRGIYFRDQGTCVICQRDLSGILNTDQRVHYDHIVPLNLGGSNDPSNVQLLCEDCNLRKSDRSSETTSRYALWWDYEN